MGNKRDTRNPQMKAEFKTMLGNANLLYLGGKVLILLDKDYMVRFWTCAEAWLAMQACTPTGLRPSMLPPQRRR